MTARDSMLVTELPNGVSVVSVVSDDNGAQQHSFEVMRDGAVIGTARTLPEIATIIDQLD